MWQIIRIFVLAAIAARAVAGDDVQFDAHGQATYLRQWKPSFPSQYAGPNSLSGDRANSYSFTSTLFLAAGFGDGWEAYLNPEVTQGVPFSDLKGLGGFTNGEIARTSGPVLRGYIARAFVRKSWRLSETEEKQASEANQIATGYATERIALTVGILSVLDLFDTVDYSRDARTQFMNWSSLTYGAWDYPADARGYTRGIALEYISKSWSLRAGRFMLPEESNGLPLDGNLAKHRGDMVELELPFSLLGRPAVARGLAFRNRAVMGAFDDAIALGTALGKPPDLTLVRREQTKQGFGLGTQIELADDLGAYARAGTNDGKTETYAFTEIDRSISLGALAKGKRWGREKDSAGAALYANSLKASHRDYLAAGGLGFFLGDGRLSYASERIVELFYSLGVTRNAWLSLGYQRVTNPAYNRDRGPVDTIGFRAHAEF